MEDSTLIAVITVVCSSLTTVLVGVSSHVAGAITSARERRAAYELRKIETLENYFESVFGYGNSDNTRAFCKMSGIAHLYIDPKLWYLLDRIYDAKLNHDDDAAQDAAEQLLNSMSLRELRSISVRAKKHANRKNGDQCDHNG